MPFSAMRRPPATRYLARLILVAGLGSVLAACDLMGGGGGGSLAPGLTASMAAPNANLDRAAALSLINQYRGTVGAGPLSDDPSLDATAQGLAAAYAKSDKAPGLPAGAVGLRASAGYTDFAETFSGWRNTPGDAAVLGEAKAARAGLATVYDPNSTYGVYWILVLGG